MKTLDYFRRFFATLFGFILFGVAGVLFKIALLPYTLKSTKGDIKRQLEARRMIGRVWRFFVGYLQWSGVLSVRFNGLEKLGRPGQLILANHPSLLDVVLLISHYSERRNAETVVNIIGLYGRGSGIFSALSEDRQDVSVVHTLAGGMHSAFCLPAFRLSILNHGSFFLLDAGRCHCRNRR